MSPLDHFDQYHATWLALWLIFATIIAQSLIAAGIHAKGKGAIPGTMNPKLSHESLEFRAHRTFHNSLENLPFMVGPIFIAILTGMNPAWLGALSWVYAIARLMHMALYYLIATEKNPSPRSYFYLTALVCNLILMGLLLQHLLLN
ncbi:MAG: MAPEG family protein [Oceanobacter sp.]